MIKTKIIKSTDDFEVTCERDLNGYGTRIGLTFWGLYRKGEDLPIRYFSSRREAYAEIEKLEDGSNDCG